MEIRRYVLVDPEDNEQDYEFESDTEATKAAQQAGYAIVCRSYVYDDTYLIWTPDGSDTWPPAKVETAEAER